MKMKFKITQDGDSDTDTDYETAIDIVTTTVVTEEYKLETMAGSQISLEIQSTSKSNQYLEPDFDLMEKTGKTVYVNKDGGEQSSEYSLLMGKSTDLIHTLTEEQFKEYFKKHYDKPLDELDTVELKDFYNFKAQQQGIQETDPNYTVIKVQDLSTHKELLNNIQEALKTNPDSKGYHEVEIPNVLVPAIEKIESESFRINSINSSNKINTNVHVINNDIQESINESVNKHKGQMFNPQYGRRVKTKP